MNLKEVSELINRDGQGKNFNLRCEMVTPKVGKIHLIIGTKIRVIGKIEIINGVVTYLKLVDPKLHYLRNYKGYALNAKLVDILASVFGEIVIKAVGGTKHAILAKKAKAFQEIQYKSQGFERQRAIPLIYWEHRK